LRKNRILLRFAVLALAAGLVYLGGLIGSFASAQTGAPVPFQVLHDFAGGSTDGNVPEGSLILSGKTLYGMTYGGGANGGGTIFEFNTQTNKLTVLHSFAGGTNDGVYPYGNLILSGKNLYGLTYNGGAKGDGTIFEFNTQTGKLTILHSFDGTDGANPTGSLILSGKNLYGLTYRGGASGVGTIFEFNTQTGQLTTLHSFDGTDGTSPYSSLTLSGKNLYGMTTRGGANGDGTIFEFSTQTNKLTVLHSFAGGTDDGASPSGSLILSGINLYGMTFYGGANSNGTIFEFNTQTNKLTVLHSFAGGLDDGANPNGGLILSGKTLYGMTAGGGNSIGTIFEFNTQAGQVTVLHSFAGEPTDGSHPQGSLVLSGKTLYGMTSAGGADNDGVIFSYSLK